MKLLGNFDNECSNPASRTFGQQPRMFQSRTFEIGRLMSSLTSAHDSHEKFAVAVGAFNGGVHRADEL